MTDTAPTLCPSCGRPYDIPEFHRRAEEFCPDPECDYPLFWAPNSVIAQAPESSEVDAMRRQPGTTGLGTQASHSALTAANSTMRMPCHVGAVVQISALRHPPPPSRCRYRRRTNCPHRSRTRVAGPSCSRGLC